MKQLLLTLFALLLIGCEKEFKEIPPNYIGYDSTSPNDSTLSVLVVNTDNNPFIRLIKNGQVIKEADFKTYSKTIDTGYGEIKTCETHVKGVLFLNNRIIVSQGSDDGKFGYLDFFTTELNHTGNKELSANYNGYIGLTRWDKDSFFADYKTNEKETQTDFLDDKGNIKETWKSESYPTFPNEEYIITTLDNLEYITIKNEVIERSSVKNGGIWQIYFSDHVKNKPETETNEPKIAYSKHELSNNTISVFLNVTYYSGAKEQIILKIDINKGEVI